MKKRLLFLGPPGAGKGTQAHHIVKKFKLFQVSTGDLLRNEIKKKTHIGKEIEEIPYDAASINEIPKPSTELLTLRVGIKNKLDSDNNANLKFSFIVFKKTTSLSKDNSFDS